jgi:alkylation response protein AidB-like acyl-CoA dehydrogenase
MPSIPESQTREALLGLVERVRPVLQAGAHEAETLRALPRASVEVLRESGLFAMWAPRDVGGLEADPLTQMEVIERVTQINASAGWCLFIGAGVTAMVGAFAKEQAIEQIFRQEEWPIMAGAFAPMGTAEQVEQGYRIRGRWSYGSGIRHASWVCVSAVVSQDGRPVMTAQGAPRLIQAIIPTTQVMVEDTWHVMGLRGTGSAHYSVQDVFVEEGFTYPFPAAPVRRGGALFRLADLGFITPAHSAFALGMAGRALSEVVTAATVKLHPWTQGTVAMRGSFQKELGLVRAKFTSARLFAFETVGTLWRAALEGREPSLDEWAMLRAAATLATDVALEVVTMAYRHAGGAALYEQSPLQLYLRDMLAAAQHFITSDEGYEFAGRSLLGIAEPHPLFLPRRSI